MNISNIFRHSSRKLIFGGIGILIFVIILGLLFFMPPSEPIWGISFSQKVSTEMGLDWRATYDAILSDLGAHNLRIATYWNMLEPSPSTYAWEDLDYQVRAAEKAGAKLTLALGRKTPRWPECHMPDWVAALPIEHQQAALLDMLRAVVSRYKDSLALERWQVENEPFLGFGGCSLWAESFLDREIAAVRELDPAHKIVVTDSGELSMWWRIARHGDLVGVTMYRRVWSDVFHRYVTFPIPAAWYELKAILARIFSNKSVINVELQAEPWGNGLPSSVTPENERQTMSPEIFESNLDYARRTSLSEVYLWGAEWWYFKKTVQNNSAYWDLARPLFESK